MSIISTIYDEVISVVQTVTPGWTLLPIPYRVEANAELFLKKGVGIRLADGTNTNRQAGCAKSVQRNFEITYTKQVFTTESNREITEAAEKELLEAHASLTSHFEKEAHLNIVGNPSFVFESDAGIETVFDDKDNFIKITSIFSCEYFENL